MNTLSPGDSVLMYETGHFATLWKTMAERLGLDVEFSPAIGDTAPIRLRSKRGSPKTGARDQGGLRGSQRDLDRASHESPQCAKRWTAPVIRRC